MIGCRGAALAGLSAVFGAGCQIAFPIHEASDLCAPPAFGGTAAVPVAVVSTDWIAPTGMSRPVTTAAELSQALLDVQPGDEIVLEAGVVYSGTFTLPYRSGEGWITIRSSSVDRSGIGQRVDKGCTGCFATLEAIDQSALVTEPGAHHFRLVGLEIRASGALVESLVKLGSDTAANPAEQAHHLVVDRCYVHGTRSDAFVSGIVLAASSSAIVDSLVEDIHHSSGDPLPAGTAFTAAIDVHNSGGPILLRNNEVVAFDHAVIVGLTERNPDLRVRDVTVCRNHLHRDPDRMAETWVFGELIGLGGVDRMLAIGNVLDQTWRPGCAVAFKQLPSTDVSFAYNRLSDADGGISVDYTHQRARFVHNLVDVTGDSALVFNGSLNELDFRHNTVLHASTAMMFTGSASTGATLVDNLIDHGANGIVGDQTADGTLTLTQYLPDAQFTSNAIVGGDALVYPAGNFFPASLLDIVVDPIDDFRVAPGSPYAKQASDGSDVGADFDELASRTNGVAP